MDKLVFIIPTGIGASIGGYAGDGGAYARKLTEKFELIVNPNVVNAACFSAINDKMFYTEGYAIDSFFKREIALRPSSHNKIGVIFDCEIPENILNIHLNTLNAMRVVYGIEDIEIAYTKYPVGIDFSESSGVSTGNIKNLDTLFDAARELLQKGCRALSVVCLFEDTQEEDDEYLNGTGIDIVGGVEAVISHSLTKEFKLPVAHAPAFRNIEFSEKIVSPKAAAEYITSTFLPCIILGLEKAPQLIDFKYKKADDICLDDVKGLVVPYNTLGSIAVLKANEYNVPIYAIKENQTVLNVTAEKLGLKVVQMDSYVDLLNSI